MTVAEHLFILKRGAAELIPEEEFTARIGEGKPFTVKVGFDPTAPDLHLGHTVLLHKMKHFQQLGHRVVFVIGDFTGMIGDPSGKSDIRKALTRDEVLANAATYKEQVFKVLDPKLTEIRFNSEWLAPLTAEDMIRLAAKFTVARMLERDDFEKRYNDNKPIGIHEFFYPLMQGYDSVALNADVELGGTDQKFNLLVGRELMKASGLRPQMALTVPLLVGLDGVQKMSKSLNNYVGIYESSDEIFGKLMSISDSLMIEYYTLLSDKSVEAIDSLKSSMASGELNPMQAKKELAEEITARYHGQHSAREARERFEQIFSRHENPEDMIEFTYTRGEELLDIIVKLNFAPSRNEARRLGQQGGVTLNGEKALDLCLKPEGEQILKVGKRKFAKIKES
ncbi:MAG: tyrosine--tRNA ligase [Deferribacteraceae bacterium]|jgi:tyrosyl-tRNA synthetase|nr:tyrosine--tRNA ligase [Deferribacteraceae bacterium]